MKEKTDGITQQAEYSELEKAIGYEFKDKEKIKMALTHSSYMNEMKGKEAHECNERLEFLGDSVLSYITSRYLYKKYPELPEGRLSPIRAAVVCEKTLAKLGKEIKLGEYMYFGHGEQANGRTNIAIIADAFEALLAAVFLDGGIEPAEKFLMPLIVRETEEIVKAGTYIDYKTELQQMVQRDRGSILEYVTVSESGPAHRREFEVEARLNGNTVGSGCGLSKREAAQKAAKEALELFGVKTSEKE